MTDEQQQAFANDAKALFLAALGGASLPVLLAMAISEALQLVSPEQELEALRDLVAWATSRPVYSKATSQDEAAAIKGAELAASGDAGPV